MSDTARQAEQDCAVLQECGAIERIIRPRDKDLGGFSVRRSLPTAGRNMVGPWIFFDHMGPADFPAGQGIKVRPHPHVNIATVTYLFEGEILHRDSLGSVQAIRPGDINLMVAGSGIVRIAAESAWWTVDVAQGRFCRTDTRIDPHFIPAFDWTPVVAVCVTPTRLRALTVDGVLVTSVRAHRVAIPG